VILHENKEAGFELGDNMDWRILRENIRKLVLQYSLADTGEASDDKKTGKSENVVETGFIGTWKMLIRMWTE
jgi:hypothetical protein